jgi:hypothetical protein
VLDRAANPGREQAKNHLLLDYNIHLTYLMLLKLHGTPTASHASRGQFPFFFSFFFFLSLRQGVS